MWKTVDMNSCPFWGQTVTVWRGARHSCCIKATHHQYHLNRAALLTHRRNECADTLELRPHWMAHVKVILVTNSDLHSHHISPQTPGWRRCWSFVIFGCNTTYCPIRQHVHQQPAVCLEVQWSIGVKDATYYSRCLIAGCFLIYEASAAAHQQNWKANVVRVRDGQGSINLFEQRNGWKT